jgi:HPr kinase/phosphorylase
MPNPSHHATALAIGAKAVVIFGQSGAGKSHLAYELLKSHPHTRLIGDDRVYLEAHHGRLIVRPVEKLQGLLELRGVGLLRFSFEPQAQVSHIFELVKETQRLSEAQTIKIEGITLPSVKLQIGQNAMHNLLAFLDEQTKNL